MFENYPKERIELPANYKAIYFEHYKNNREGKTSTSSITQRMERWMHRKVAADVKNDGSKVTLEIGAGTLNQLQFEQTGLYDIVEPFKELYANSEYLNRINKIYNDIAEINESEKYDRIISVATFEHILNLPDVIAKTCILLKNSGSLRVAIPNEGEFLWKLGWKLTSAIEFKIKYGIDYELLMKYEHVNKANEIEELLRYFYNDVNYSYFGVTKKLAFYRFLNCRKPKVEVANNYLKQ